MTNSNLSCFFATCAAAMLLTTASDAAVVGTVTSAPATVDLTTEGTLGWSKYAVSADSNATGPTIVEKIGGVSIGFENSNPANNGGNGQYGTEIGNFGSSFSWIDGNQQLTGDGDVRKIQLDATDPATQNATFTFTVPSTALDRTINLYLGLFDGSALFTATLFDAQDQAIGSPYTNTDIAAAQGTILSQYAVTYSGGDHLTVTYKLTQAINTFGGYSSVQVAGASLLGAPVPEPSSIALLAVAGVVIALHRRLRQV